MNLAATYVGEKLFEQTLKLVSNNPEKNIPRLITLVEKMIRDASQKEVFSNIKELLCDQSNNWYRYIVRLLTKTHPNVRQRLAVNFFINAVLAGLPKQRAMEQKLGVGVPWAILIDPTEKCNLHCTGCWAGDYQRAHDLEYDLLDRVVTEAEQLGIHFIIFSGGEPTVRKNDIFKLAEQHPNQVFMMFTNGTLIDEDFVAEMVRLGNVSVALSMEGFKDKTDARRGKGIFQKVMHAMDLMREAGVVFGASVTYTHETTEELGSDKFVDMLVDKGAAFVWYFTYIPIGKDVDLQMMATPEQRAWMFERIRAMRKTKPIFLMDFWNDGDSCNGCIAGGRRYFHINANGDVEPCAFVHYSTCNIKNISLEQALKNPLFKAYQKRQPFNHNLLRPCPVIDNPEMLRDIVTESGAKWTQQHADESPEEFADKLSPYAEQWGSIADGIWSRKEAAATSEQDK